MISMEKLWRVLKTHHISYFKTPLTMLPNPPDHTYTGEDAILPCRNAGCDLPSRPNGVRQSETANMHMQTCSGAARQAPDWLG